MKSDKTEAIYKYDPTGRRESKTVNGKTTTHRWDGSNIVSEAGERSNGILYGNKPDSAER